MSVKFPPLPLDYSCTVPPRETRFGSSSQKTKNPAILNQCVAPRFLPPYLPSLWMLTPQCGPAFDFVHASRSATLSVTVPPETLRKIVPTLSVQRASAVSPPLDIAMTEAEANTPLRKAAFLAQTAHESGGFRWVREFGNTKYFSKYDGRTDLGNTEPGDGARFKGRGFIQLTGRNNYTEAGQDLGLDLVNDPELVERDLEVAARVSGWFWQKNNLNRFADSDNFIGLTRAINGGTNGLPDRQAYYARAKVAFGIVSAKAR